jgi:hypothetical protein
MSFTCFIIRLLCKLLSFYFGIHVTVLELGFEVLDDTEYKLL